MKPARRELLRLAGAGALAAVGGCAGIGGQARPKVVVVGGGYGGATIAKYLRMWSGGAIDVDLVERDPQFVSCPLSNLVLGGSRTLADLTHGYDALARRHGVRIVRGDALAIDAARRQVKLAGGVELRYDRLVLSPGIDFMFETIPGLASAAAREQVLHAWKAGPQTLALRAQLEAMPDGGVYALHIPKAPYRCPPGPYERACQVAGYLKRAKPRSKVLVLDANAEIVSKKGLFTKAWNELYGPLIEYRPNSELLDVDAATRTAKLVFGDERADVLNVVPPQKAAAIAAPFITSNQRWCEVDWLSCESKAAPYVHLLGDATLSAPQMPKSGHMANQHGHLCADAIIALLSGRAPNPQPVVTNTCYSFVSDSQVVHVSTVHRFDAEKKTLVMMPGGGVSPGLDEGEAPFGQTWARNIWADMLA